uniref:Rho GDP dissociation inhibitor gamma n=1 Tax=Capra hircus TaxID=9925 RepID=A0A8C2R773_CAPHI
LSPREPAPEVQGGQLPPEEALDEAVPEYRAPGKKSLLEIQQLDPDDESLVKYKLALLGPVPPAMVDKAVYMVGSYGPSAQEYEFVTPVEEVPRGALVRGAYVVTTAHMSWEWGLHVCQDWER